MSSLFRRKPAELVPEQIEEVQEPEPAPRKAYTPKKGEATPKRPVANPRMAMPTPANSKEARALARRKRQEDAAARRAGMARGDDEYLPVRDRGLVRRYVRDIVDARRNIGSIFFFGTVLVLVLSLTPVLAVQVGSNLLFLAMLLLIVGDSVLLSRRVKKLVQAKFPDHTDRWSSLYIYAIMRALAFRKMRVPKPQVKIGDPIT